ncbi:MAG: serine hydrolase [Propionibacteriaceae bacterium]|nr:serine hydrolase [Propionibacteriaceae bacterium]
MTVSMTNVRRRSGIAVFLLGVLALGLLVVGGRERSSSVAQTGTSEGDCDTLWQRSGSGWYESNPTYTDPADDSSDWAISAPAAEGIDLARLEAGVEALENSSLFSVLVVRNDSLVFEEYFNGSARSSSNNVHSASKSVLGAALAIAVERGDIPSLDTRVSDVLPEYFTGSESSRSAITLRDLMTMSAGLSWTEDETEYKIESSTDWVAAVLGQRMASTPGTSFTYSTGNTHVLSAIIQRATGMGTCEFVHQYLFSPMNVTAEHWGRDPQGVSSGGYNLYLTPRELAKFGLLMLHDGTWKGQQLVPAKYIQEAQRTVFDVDATTSYGELFWVRTIAGHKTFFAWGWGGQFVYVIPDEDLVLVITQNTSDDHANREVDAAAFIEESLLPSIA